MTTAREIEAAVFSPDWNDGIHPALKLLALFVLPAILQQSAATWLLSAVTALCVTLACYLCRSTASVVVLLLPFVLLVAVVSFLMLAIGQQSPESVLRYGTALLLTGAGGIAVLRSTGLIELAQGLDLLLRPIRAIGIDTGPLSLGVVVAVRLFFVGVGELGSVKRAFVARGLSLEGIGGIRRYGLAVLMRLHKVAEDMSITLVMRGIDTSDLERLVRRSYLWSHGLLFALVVVSISAVSILVPPSRP